MATRQLKAPAPQAPAAPARQAQSPPQKQAQAPAPTPVSVAIKPTFHSSPSNKVRPIGRTANTSANEILKDGYDHKKFFGLKTKSLLNLGQSVTLQSKSSVRLGEKKTASGATVPEPIPEINKSWLRLTTSFDRFTVEARIWGDGRFKIALDAGYLNKKNNNDNLFGLVRANHQLTKWRAGLGLVHNLTHGGYLSGRLRIDETQAPLLDVKSLLNHQKWRFFENIGVNLASQHFSRYNSFLAYLDKDFDVILAHESLSKKIELGRIVASLVFRQDKYSFATQLRYKQQKGSRFIFGVSAPLNDNTTVKAKIDSRLKLTTQAKIKLHKNVSLGLAAQVKLAEGKNALNFNKTLPLPIGFSLDCTL